MVLPKVSKQHDEVVMVGSHIYLVGSQGEIARGLAGGVPNKGRYRCAAIEKFGPAKFIQLKA